LSPYIRTFRNAVCCVITYRTRVNCAWDHPRMTKTSTIIAGHNTFITQRSLTQCTSRDDKSFSHHSIRYRPVLRVSVKCYTQSKSTVITTRTASFHTKSFSIFPAQLYAFRIILPINSIIMCLYSREILHFVWRRNCAWSITEQTCRLQKSFTHTVPFLAVQAGDAWKRLNKSDALL